MAEDVDIVLQLRNLQQFIAGAKEAADSLGRIGTASERSSAQARASASRVPGVIGLIGRASRESAVQIEASGRGVVGVFARIGEAATRTVGVVRSRWAALRETMSKPIGGGAMRGFGSALFTGLLTFASLSGLKNAIDFTQQLGVQSSTTARVMGTSTQTMAEYFALAQAMGVNQRTLAMAFRSTANQVEGLTKGSKSSVDMFKKLGITQADVSRRSGDMNSIFMLVLDHLNKMPGGLDKTYLATRLLGRGWQSLMPLLGEGSQHLRNQMKLARELGITMSGDPVKAAMQLHDAQIQLKLAGMGLEIFIATKLLPVLIWLVGKLMDVYRAVRSALGPIFQWLGDHIIKPLTNWIHTHRAAWETLRKVLVYMGVALLALKGFQTVTGGLASLFSVTNLVTFAVVALVAGLIYAYTHSKKFREIVNDVWHALKAGAVAAWPVVKAIFNALVSAVKWVIGAFNWFKANWHSIWGEVTKIAKGAWDNFLHPVFNVIRAIVVGFVVPAVKVLWQVFKVLFEVIKIGVSIAWPIMKAAFTVLVVIFRTLVIPVLKLLWTIFKAVFAGIAVAVQVAMGILKPIFQILSGAIKAVGDVVSTLGSVFSTVFSAIGSAVSGVWNSVFKPFLAWIGDFVNTITGAIKTLGDFAAAVLGIQNQQAVTAGPIVGGPVPGLTSNQTGQTGGTPYGGAGASSTSSTTGGGGIKANITKLRRTPAPVTPVNRGGLRHLQLTSIVQVDRREIARASGRFVDDEMARGR